MKKVARYVDLASLPAGGAACKKEVLSFPATTRMPVLRMPVLEIKAYRRVRCVRSLCTKSSQAQSASSSEEADKRTQRYIEVSVTGIYLRSIPCRNRAQRPHYRIYSTSRVGRDGDTMTMTASSGSDATDDQEGPAPLPMKVYGTTMQPVLLSDPLDEGTLTDAFQFCRRQIEFFTADSEDVVARHRKGGVKQEIHVGQVGIRCVHCAHVPPKTGVVSSVP